MLLKNDTLWVAQDVFVARDFDVERARGQWQPYLKHDYATFNAAHTWIEFINRCLGALAGLSPYSFSLPRLFLRTCVSRYSPFLA